MSDKTERRLFLLLVVISAISMGVLYFKARDAQNAVRKESAARIADIQHQRYIVTYNNCKDENKRHDDTIAQLTKIAKQIIKANPTERAQINKGIAQNVLLIDALAPKRDCKKIAALTVKEHQVKKNGG